LAQGFEKLTIEEIEKRNYVSIPRIYKKTTFEKEDDKFSLEQLIEEVKITVLIATRNEIETKIDSVKKVVFTSSDPDSALKTAFNQKFGDLITNTKN